MWSRVVALSALVATALSAPVAHAAEDEARYALVHGCYALKSLSKDKFVSKGGDDYALTADAGQAEAFRMQATALGRYLLYGKAADFLTADGPAAEPSPAADFRVDVADGAYRLTLPDAGDGTLVATDGGVALGAAGNESRFDFVKADGCAVYPEIETNVSGEPLKAPTSYGEVRGLIDLHMHHMAYEFLGGSIHCGRPWHRYGVAYALPDCAQDDPLAGIENTASDFVLGGGRGAADPKGWPTFNAWPNHESLTYEQSYWKWIERAWRGGLRVFVNLLVDNEVLCEVLPVKRNPCNDMNSVRLQNRRMEELQDYIDAQFGGPGKGFYRIVTSPFEARKVISEGKLAVVKGIEVSRLFDCGIVNDVPDCDRARIDKQLQDVYDMGVRSMEIVNKFDNAFAGVAGDTGATGAVVGQGNKYKTGNYWRMETCTNDGHAHDRDQTTPAGDDRDSLFGKFAGLMPPGALPLYPASPHCNRMGLTDLGEYLVRAMMKKGMLIDPDHMSAYGRAALLNVAEAERYSGLVSSHSWADPPSLPRIYALGGIVTPMAGNAKSFLEAYKETKPGRSDKFLFGIGYGADMNGFATQGGPRAIESNPVTYPFKSFDGGLTIDKQRSGEQEYDVNVDGIAHYGLFPDWLEDLRILGGQQVVDDMARGAEAYLQTWERARGIAAPGCRGKRVRVTRAGQGGVLLRQRPEAILRRAGQPKVRGARVWRWCVAGRENAKRDIRVVFTKGGSSGLVGSTAALHRVGRVGPGAPIARVKGTRRLTASVRVKGAGKGAKFVFGVRGGKITWVGVAAASVAKRPGELKRLVRLSGLR